MALENIHELAPSVFSVDSRFVDGKNGIVIGKRAALAIDGSNYGDEGAAMASFIRQNGFEPHRLALTHGHGDHILGAGPLAQGEIFAHALTPVEIEKQIPGWAARWAVDEAEARARVIQPTITYQDELRMDLGGLHAWMFPTPGHSPDGVSIYIEAFLKSPVCPLRRGWTTADAAVPSRNPDRQMAAHDRNSGSSLPAVLSIKFPISLYPLAFNHKC